MAVATVPDDVLFWREVREAVSQVKAHANRELTVGVGTNSARVFAFKKKIIIELSDRTPPQPTLIVPPGGGDKD